MSLTLREVKEKLVQHWDILDIIEFFGITAEDLVREFTDKIQDRFEELEMEFTDEDE